MRILIVSLILSSFLQTTVIPINLVLLILLSRSFITQEKINFLLAFWFGLLVSYLSNETLGLLSIIYLLGVILAQILRRFSFYSHWLSMIPLFLIVLFTSEIIHSLTLQSSLDIAKIFYQTAFAIPVFSIVKFWEERFVVPPEVKLKIRER